MAISSRPKGPKKFDYTSGVKKNGEFDYSIDKQMLDEQLTDLTQLGMQARSFQTIEKVSTRASSWWRRPGSLYRSDRHSLW